MPEKQTETTTVRRLLQRIGNPLEWSLANKCLAVSLLMPVLFAGYAISARMTIYNRALAPYFDITALHWLLRINLGEAAYWLLLSLVCLAVRYRGVRTEPTWLAHLVIESFILTHLVVAYFLGPSTSPIAGVGFLGAMFLGVLLFPASVMVAGAATLATALWALEIAGWRGWIPYAPLLAQAPFGGGRVSGWWMFNSQGTVFALAGMTTVLFLYTVRQWRRREIQLLEAYQDLRRTKDQLVRAESLAAMGSLVTGAAHELRNPLASSHGLFQSLREDLTASKNLSEQERTEALRTIDMALKGHKRAALIAERLYSLTDALETQRSTASLADFLETIRSRYPCVRVESDGAETKIRIPEALMETVVPNLLDNALAAGGKDPPKLEVRLAPVSTSSPNVEAGRQGRGMEVTVSDSGAGISKAMRADVFKPFFTGQKAGEGHGVGLGLYIVHELVSRMGGTVELESEEGEGTRVIVKVPVAS